MPTFVYADDVPEPEVAASEVSDEGESDSIPPSDDGSADADAADVAVSDEGDAESTEGEGEGADADAQAVAEDAEATEDAEADAEAGEFSEADAQAYEEATVDIAAAEAAAREAAARAAEAGAVPPDAEAAEGRVYEPMADGDVQPINNPAGTTMTLFDYWVVDGPYAPYYVEPLWGASQSDNGNFGGNNGINSGHALKFRKLDSDLGNTWNWDSIGLANVWTGDTQPFGQGLGPVMQGIVQPTLGTDGYPVLSNNNRVRHPYQDTGNTHTLFNSDAYNTEYANNGNKNPSLAYLFDPNKDATKTGSDYVNGKQTYAGVDGLFQVDDQGFYYYDSRENSANLDSNNRFVLGDGPQDAAGDGYTGFWPFGTGDNRHYFGMHLNTPFSQPVNGQVLNPQGQYVDMSFEFTGDDDVWLYIDGVLIGDLGGIHFDSHVSINFATGEVLINHGNSSSGISTTIRALWEAAGADPPEGGWNGNTFQPGTNHVMDFFYLERGNDKSNLDIKYNLISTADFTAHKSLAQEGGSSVLQRDQFMFDLIALDGLYEVTDDDARIATPVEGAENEEAVLPVGATGHSATEPPAPGDVTRHYQDDISYTLSDGTTVNTQVYTIGNAEDGNVNFGNIEVPDNYVGKAYRYIISEQVPAGATINDDGTYTIDDITYVPTKYYFVAKIVMGDNGRPTVRKTYYTDDTFSERAAVTFPSFVNLKGEVPRALVELHAHKTLTGGKVEAGQFTFKVVDDSSGREITRATNDANGDVTFDMPLITLVDFADQLADDPVVDAQHPLTLTRAVTISEVIPEGVDSDNVLNGIQYPDSAHNSQQATITATYDGHNITTDVVYASSGGAEFENRVLPIEVEAEKVWNDNGVEGATHPAVAFTLHAYTGTGDARTEIKPVKDADGDNVEVNKTIAAGATGDALKVTWINLPRFDADGNEITYEVTEAKVPNYTTAITGNQTEGFKVTNTRDTMEVSATKVWVDPEGTSLTHPEITFELKATYSVGGNPVEITPVTDANGATVEDKTIAADATGDDLTVTWTDLPKVYLVEDAQNPGTFTEHAITYTVEETGATGYETEYSPAGGVTSESQSTEITVTNTYVPFGLILIKNADLDNPVPLPGAEFTLQRMDPAEPTYSQSGTTNNSGQITFTELIPGTYKLTETRAPVGYQLPTDPTMKLVIDDNGRAWVSPMGGYDSTDSLRELSFAEGQTRVFTTTLTNTELPPLPASGGPGTVWMSVIAALLLMWGIGALALRRWEGGGAQ